MSLRIFTAYSVGIFLGIQMGKSIVLKSSDYKYMDKKSINDKKSIEDKKV